MAMPTLESKSPAYILAHVPNDEISNVFEDILGCFCFAFLFFFLICNHFQGLITETAENAPQQDSRRWLIFVSR